MYKVKTDEEFFNRFNDIKRDIDRIASYFQNEGMTLSAIELGNYNMTVNETKRKFTKLINEANKRVERVK